MRTGQSKSQLVPSTVPSGICMTDRKLSTGCRSLLLPSLPQQVHPPRFPYDPTLANHNGFKAKTLVRLALSSRTNKMPCTYPGPTSMVPVVAVILGF